MDRSEALIIRPVAVSSGIPGILVEPKNRVAESVFIRRILAYSAKKKRANGPPAYSTLKPETSSDSPSVKSKGARFVSASVEIYHIAAKGQAGITSQIASCATLKVCNVKPPVKMIAFNTISPRLTSYEMVCATARRAPMRAYFELEAQPDPRIEYTARLERARMKRTPRLRSITGYGRGIGAQRVRARVRASMGAKRNSTGEEVEGRTGSLMKSFTPSAIGCKSP